MTSSVIQAKGATMCPKQYMLTSSVTFGGKVIAYNKTAQIVTRPVMKYPWWKF